MVLRVDNSMNIYSVSSTKPVTVYNKNSSSIFNGINGIIEDSKQGDKGDCWLLSSLNSLSSTSWGKKIIKDAIKSDGKGGAVVTLKGSKGEQKVFNISLAEIDKAKQSGKYSSGDDDVIAFELAFEKYMKKYADKHDNNKSLGIDGNGIGIYDVLELLTGNENIISHLVTGDDKCLDEVLDEIAKNKGKYAVVCSFKEDKGNLYSEHSYQVKDVITDKNGKKYVILVNPWDSSKEEKIPYDKFKSNLDIMSIVQDPADKQSNPKLMGDLERERERLNKEMEKLLKEKENMQNSKNATEVCLKIMGELMTQGATRRGKRDLTKLTELMNQINKNNISHMSPKMIESFIASADILAYGFGNGKEKKALIMPIITALEQCALEKGINKKYIDDFKKACLRELDATFYTNEKVIIREVTKMLELIKAKK